VSKPYISLQPSEVALLQAAAQILSAHIIAGNCTSENEEEYAKNAIKRAIKMAKITDENVQADKEVM